MCLKLRVAVLLELLVVLKTRLLFVVPKMMPFVGLKSFAEKMMFAVQW